VQFITRKASSPCRCHLSGHPPVAVPGRKVRRQLEELKPDAVHIATKARSALPRALVPAQQVSLHHVVPHQFPNTCGCARAFRSRGATRHALVPRRAAAVMVATATLHQRLTEHGFTNLAYWSRGVDTEHFKPRPRIFSNSRADFPVHGTRGDRKEYRAFLKLDLPGTKMVVGGDPTWRC